MQDHRPEAISNTNILTTIAQAQGAQSGHLIIPLSTALVPFILLTTISVFSLSLSLSTGSSYQPLLVCMFDTWNYTTAAHTNNNDDGCCLTRQ